MRFGILGTLRIQGPGGAVPVLGHKRRVLLTALLARANDVVPVDQLVDWLWPDRPPRSAVPTVQAHVSALRRVIEPDRERWAASQTLLTRPTGYLIRVAPEQLDALHFEQLVSRAELALRHGAAGDASRMLRQGLQLWRGAALA
jgi:DNA-binding SARP family transcriptional activator